MTAVLVQTIIATTEDACDVCGVSPSVIATRADSSNNESERDGSLYSCWAHVGGAVASLTASPTNDEES